MTAVVTQSFKDVWSRRRGKAAVLRMRYKRRYYQAGSPSGFVYEANYHDILWTRLVEIEDISIEVDRQFENTLKITEVTIRLPDPRGEWIRSGASGIFAKDAAAVPDDGYDDYHMEVVLEFGYKVDGQPDYVSMFTGLSGTPIHGEDATVQLTISAKALERLRSADASKVNAGAFGPVPLAEAADGSEQDFHTSETGVSRVGSLTLLNGVTISAGVNDAIDFDEGGSELGATIAPGTYRWGASDAEAGTLCAAIKTALEAAGAGTYRVTFDYDAKVPTIAQTAGPSPAAFGLHWASGARAGSSAAAALGYGSDNSGALSYTAPNATGSTALIQGVDYNVSRLDDPRAAEIRIEVAPAAGVTPLVTGERWLEDQLAEELVEALCDEAGIPEAKRIIAPSLFPGGLSGQVTVNDQVDWEDATLNEGLETADEPGSVFIPVPLLDASLYETIDDFDDGDFTSNPAWNQQGSGAASVSAGVLSLGNAGGNVALSVPRTDAIGMWRLDIGAWAGLPFVGLMLGGETLLGGGLPNANGYVFGRPGDGTPTIFWRIDSGTPTVLLTLPDPANKTVYIVRTSSGRWDIYYDDGSGPTLEGSLVDATYNSGSYVMVGNHQQTDTGTWELDFIGFRDAATPAVIEYEQDLGGAPTAFGTLESLVDLNGGEVTIRTTTKPLAGSYEGLSSLSPGPSYGLISSSLQRFFKIRLEVKLDPVTISSPRVHRMIANFTTNVVRIAVANFRGMSCLDGVELLARLLDYETGSTGEDVFYWRPKTVSPTPVLHLTVDNVISRLRNYSPGYDRVANVGFVRYGSHSEEYDGAAAGELEPTSETRFGRIVATDDLSTFLTAADVNIAAARAQIIYERRHRPRKRLVLECKIVPWLEVGDVVRVTYYTHPLYRGQTWGDPLAVISRWRPWVAWGQPQNVLARDLDCKIIGVQWQLLACRMVLTLEEVLT